MKTCVSKTQGTLDTFNTLVGNSWMPTFERPDLGAGGYACDNALREKLACMQQVNLLSRSLLTWFPMSARECIDSASIALHSIWCHSVKCQGSSDKVPSARYSCVGCTYLLPDAQYVASFAKKMAMFAEMAAQHNFD